MCCCFRSFEDFPLLVAYDGKTAVAQISLECIPFQHCARFIHRIKMQVLHRKSLSANQQADTVAAFQSREERSEDGPTSFHSLSFDVGLLRCLSGTERMDSS
jgi:hypothetical protein